MDNTIQDLSGKAQRSETRRKVRSIMWQVGRATAFSGLLVLFFLPAIGVLLAGIGLGCIVVSFMLRERTRSSGGYRMCRFYGFSVFAIGVISFVALLIFACPELNPWGDGWNPHLVISAFSELVMSAIWGCFIFSQLSCAKKLRDYSIAAGTAPWHLLIARNLCTLLALSTAIGSIYLIGGNPKEIHADWMLQFTLSIAPTLLYLAGGKDANVMIGLSAFVVIWHLIGTSYVIGLIRDNVAKIQSIGHAPDNKAAAA